MIPLIMVSTFIFAFIFVCRRVVFNSVDQKTYFGRPGNQAPDIRTLGAQPMPLEFYVNYCLNSLKGAI